MWNPFKKKKSQLSINQEIFNLQMDKQTRTLYPLYKIYLSIRINLSEHDFQHNLTRVKEVADKLEPVVHLLRTQQRALARLEILSLNKKPMIMDEETPGSVDGGSADTSTPAAPA